MRSPLRYQSEDWYQLPSRGAFFRSKVRIIENVSFSIPSQSPKVTAPPQGEPLCSQVSFYAKRGEQGEPPSVFAKPFSKGAKPRPTGGVAKHEAEKG